jgi:hypothetical protein
MHFDEGGGSPPREGNLMAARDQLVAVAVHDALIILDDLERRRIVDAARAVDIRLAAIRVTGTASPEENNRFWSNYAELVVLSQRLDSGAVHAVQPHHAGIVRAALGRVGLRQVVRYGAIAAALFVLVFAVDNVRLPTMPNEDETGVAVAATAPAPPPAVATAGLTAALAAEPAYYVGYGRDHPNFTPRPAPRPPRFDPPQMGM